MRLQIVAYHPLSSGLSSLSYLGFLLCNLASVLIPFLHDTLMLCYMYRVIIGGNSVRLSNESGMQETRLISLDCHLPDTCTSVCVKHWHQETDKSKSKFHYLPEINNC